MKCIYLKKRAHNWSQEKDVKLRMQCKSSEIFSFGMFKCDTSHGKLYRFWWLIELLH